MNRSRFYLYPLSFLVIFPIIAGCGGGNGGGGGGASNLTGIGSVEGFAFVNPTLRSVAMPRARLTLRRQASDVQNGITLRPTAETPVGFTPLPGATLSVDSGQAGTTEANGHFLITGVPAGQRRLRVTPVGGGGEAEFPLTAIGDANVVVGTRAVSRQQAIDRVRQLLPGEELNRTIVVATQNPLPPGVIVAPGMGNARGQADASLAYTVPSPQWLVYTDQFSDALFRHPVQFHFVDVQTGEITSRQATSWPTINGVGFYANHDLNLESDDAAQAPTQIAAQVPALTGLAQTILPPRNLRNRAIRLGHVPCQSGGAPRSFALLIQGGDERAMNNSFEELRDLLINTQGVAPADLHTITPPASRFPLSQVRTTLDNIKRQLRPCDTLYLFIVAHGFGGGVAVVNDSRATTLFEDLNPYHDSATSPLFAEAVANELKDARACHIFVYVDACQSGSWIPPMMAALDPKPGLEAAVLCSTSADMTGSFVQSEFELQRPGLVFTRYFVENMADLSSEAGGGPVDPFLGFDAAVNNLRRNAGATVTGIYASRGLSAMPTAWVRPLRPGETCTGAATPPVTEPPPPLVSLTPASLTATHTVGVSPCPQLIGVIRLDNNINSDVNYTATSGHTAIDLRTIIQLTGGQTVSDFIPGGVHSVNIEVYFDCSQLPPISTTIQITVTDGTRTESFTVPVTVNPGGSAGGSRVNRSQRVAPVRRP